MKTYKKYENILCVNDWHAIDKAHPKKGLTIGKVYQVQVYNDIGTFTWIIDDYENHTYYRKDNFISLNDIKGLREYKLKKLNEI